MTPVSGSSPASRPAPSADALRATRAVAAQRWKVAIVLTLGMVLVYFGFIALVAFAPATLGTLISDGLSVGIVLGACVIVAAWLLTFAYVRWANSVYDPALAALRDRHASGDR
jgi:uncharacterized membrane protein (DUF485 family)